MQITNVPTDQIGFFLSQPFRTFSLTSLSPPLISPIPLCMQIPACRKLSARQSLAGQIGFDRKPVESYKHRKWISWLANACIIFGFMTDSEESKTSQFAPNFPFSDHRKIPINFPPFANLLIFTDLVRIYDKHRPDPENGFGGMQCTHALTHTQQCRDFVYEGVTVGEGMEVKARNGDPNSALWNEGSELICVWESTFSVHNATANKSKTTQPNSKSIDQSRPQRSD